jgi:hypothetical protein
VSVTGAVLGPVSIGGGTSLTFLEHATAAVHISAVIRILVVAFIVVPRLLAWIKPKSGSPGPGCET